MTLMASTRVLNHHILSCKFSPAVDGLVSCTTSTSDVPFGPGNLNVYRHSQNDELKLETSIAWNEALLDTCWSTSHNDSIVAASGDGSLQLWKIFSKIKKPVATFFGHNGSATSVQWRNGGNNESILSGSLDGTLKIWDIESRAATLTQKFDEEVLQSSASRAIPNLIISVLANRKLGISDDRFPSNHDRVGMQEQVLSCDWSPHIATQFITSSSAGNLICFDIRFLNPRTVVSQMHCHNGPARRARWIPAFRDIVASVGFDGITALTDMANASILERVMHHSNFVYDVDCSPFHPHLLADCSWDSLLHVFEPRSLISRPLVSTLLNKL